MVYVEGPTGVGFSYSDGFSDDNSSDSRASLDFYHALDDLFAEVSLSILLQEVFERFIMLRELLNLERKQWVYLAWDLSKPETF